MEKDEELEEAKRRYPIGTKFRSPQSGTVYVINQDIYWPCGTNIRCETDNGRFSPYLKYNGKWAQIISLPEVVVNNYSIY